MDKKLAIFIGVAAVAIIGIFIGVKNFGWFSNDDNSSTISSEQIALFDPAKLITRDNIPADFTGNADAILDHYSGSKDSKVTVIEYADFQCPGCASQNPKLEKIRSEFGDKITWVYRYYPIISIHPNTIAATATAEAVSMQDESKFWEIHNLLFENQSDWESATTTNRKSALRKLVEQIDGIDLDKWSSDYDNYKTNGIKTHFDFTKSLGDKIGVTGTPSLVINGYKLKSSDTEGYDSSKDDWSTEDKLRNLINEALK